MIGNTARGVILGASTLLGKELTDELASSTGTLWDLVLLDEADAGGQMTSAGDEAAVIQPITGEAMEAADIVFFAGDAESSARYADAAQNSGANLVDLSGALRSRSGMSLRSPWTGGGAAPDLSSIGVTCPNAAALMLAVVADRLHTVLSSPRLIATVLQPASQQGSAGLDELHQQTVSLLSFQPIPKDVYDAQVAFSVRSALGSASKVNLAKLQQIVQDDYAAVLPQGINVPLALRLLQAPVFHGFTASVFVETDGAADFGEVRKALDVGVLRLLEETEEAPSNEAAASQSQVLLSIAPESSDPSFRQGFWVWMAADNLRLLARHAAACAAELMALRPKGKLQ